MSDTAIRSRAQKATSHILALTTGLRVRLSAVTLTGLAIVVLCAWLAPAHWVFDLVAQFLLPALVGAVGLAGLAGVLGRWRVSAGAVGLLAAASPLLSNGPAAIGQDGGVRIYQHNVLVGNQTPEAVAAAIQAADADVAILMEAPSRFLGAFGRLNTSHPHRAANVARQYLHIHSKHPLRNVQGGKTGFSWLWATVDTPDGAFDVVVIHATRPWPFDTPAAQMEQAAKFETLFDARAGDRPILLAGDFNSAPWARVARRLERRLDIRQPGGLLLGTWPASGPGRGNAIALPAPSLLGIPIDLQFTSTGLTVFNRRLKAASGSDHRAVVYSLALEDVDTP